MFWQRKFKKEKAATVLYLLYRGVPQTYHPNPRIHCKNNVRRGFYREGLY